MKYSTLVEIFKQLDATTKRLEMIDILINLFEKTPPKEFRKVIYLTSGKIGADYEDTELGFADKMVIKAIAKAIGKPEESVSDLFKKIGDLGEVAEQLLGKTGQQQLQMFFQQDTTTKNILTVDEVWDTLLKIAETEGKGSNEKKMRLLLGLYGKASPLEAKYLTRTVLSQLRFGVKDLTIIEALSRKFGDGKNTRTAIEHAYNVTSDIGEVGETIALKGLEGIAKINIRVGRPIRMMAAQRMPTVEEILEKLGGKCALEFKYDGERVQAHISQNNVMLYSRNLNDISEMYPDVVESLKKSIKSHNAIIEGDYPKFNR
ncbi:MAG: hypothetical protein ACFFDW_09745 [Candidatus Thorarchaeota archaeon]